MHSTKSPPIPGKLDRGIKKAVELLQTCGTETFESCEGGRGHAYPEPTLPAPQARTCSDHGTIEGRRQAAFAAARGAESAEPAGRFCRLAPAASRSVRRWSKAVGAPAMSRTMVILAPRCVGHSGQEASEQGVAEMHYPQKSNITHTYKEKCAYL
jgi:hypothetical protein